MRNIFQFLLAAVVCCGMVGCTSEPFRIDKDTGNNSSQELIVTVRHLYDKQSRKDSLLPLTYVDLFKNKNDLLNGEVFRSSITNKSGTVSFETQFESSFYYVKATRPGYGTFTDSIDFPANAVVSYLDLILY